MQSDAPHMNSGPSRQAPLVWVGVLLVVAALGVDLFRVWSISNHHDLDVFVLAARRLVAGEDIFADAGPFKQLVESGIFSMKDDSVAWPYMYAPLIAMLFVPVLSLAPGIIAALWWGINVVALLLGVWLTLKATGRPTPGRLLIAGILLYRFAPAVITLRLGQIELLQFLLLATTLYALGRGADGWAGAALGIAAALKFFPGALIVLLLWRRRWRAAAWAAATALVTIVATFAVVGFDALPAYREYASIYSIGGAFAAFPYNQSLNGFFSRNLVHNVFTASLRGVDWPGLAVALTLGCDLLVLVACAWLTWHRTPWERSGAANKNRRFNLEFSLGVVALLLVSPHSQVYTFIWALIPLITVMSNLLDDVRIRWPEWVALGIVYALVGREFQLFIPGVTRFVQSHYLFGALILWGLVVVALVRDHDLRSRQVPDAAKSSVS